MIHTFVLKQSYYTLLFGKMHFNPIGVLGKATKSHDSIHLIPVDDYHNSELCYARVVSLALLLANNMQLVVIRTCKDKISRRNRNWNKYLHT